MTRIVLPVGISFYTFQSMSYCIDLYRGHAKPAPSFLHFAAYVSLYPQLVAGPIVRYETVADQLRRAAAHRGRICLRADAVLPRVRQKDPAGQPDGHRWPTPRSGRIRTCSARRLPGSG